jgi:hypothetical protein
MAISLSSVSLGKRIRAPKVVVYGGAKIGKSTLGSQMANPIYIQTEEGLDALDVAKFPLATSWTDIMDSLGVLASEPHDYESVILDSLDWAEALLWAHICKLGNVASIELFGGGYGKGYLEAVKYWKDMLDAFDYLRNERGMAVLLIAHDQIKTLSPPDGEPYTYSALKLNDKASAKVCEWADVIAAATEKRFTSKTDQGFGKEHVRAIKSGQRILTVGKNPAFVTGNRFGLPDEIPLHWNAFLNAMAAAVADPVAPEKAA